MNTTAAWASALLDMRSADVASLERLAEQVQSTLAHTAGAGLHTEIEVLGERAHTLAKFLHIEPPSDRLAQVARLAIEACALVATTAQQ